MSLWYKVTISIRPPFISRQSGALPFGTDAVMFTDPEGNPAIPGTLLRGNLRESWKQIGQESLINTCLGQEHETDNQSGNLVFEPFWRITSDFETTDRTRIKMDETTRSVSNQMLQVTRALDSAQQQNDETEKPLVFTGHILALIPSSSNEVDLKNHIEKGLRMIPALGGDKGIGFGELIDVEIEQSSPPNKLAFARETLGETERKTILTNQRLGLRIRPLWPFCFPRDHPAKDNNLVSSETIPGAAIKAVIAKAAGKRIEKMQALFDTMRISHALPVKTGSLCRPLAPPLSLAIVNDHYRDLAGKHKPGLVENKAPAFQPDWKIPEIDRTKRELGWPDEIKRFLTIRNAHSIKQRAARNEALFTVESILPDDELEWLCNIDFKAEDTEIKLLLDILEEITSKQSFSPLGKTRTPAAVLIYPGGFDYAVNEQPVDGIVIATLQTPARLLNSDELTNIPTTGSEADLHIKYEEAWQDLSDGSMKLSHYFSREILKGGNYWWNSFGHQQMDRYQTQVLTDAGSVFVLKTTNGAKAKKKIDEWKRFGLPQRSGIDDCWKHNPWIRENGYGEVAFNLELHDYWGVSDKEWQDV